MTVRRCLSATATHKEDRELPRAGSAAWPSSAGRSIEALKLGRSTVFPQVEVRDSAEVLLLPSRALEQA